MSQAGRETGTSLFAGLAVAGEALALSRRADQTLRERCGGAGRAPVSVVRPVTGLPAVVPLNRHRARGVLRHPSGLVVAAAADSGSFRVSDIELRIPARCAALLLLPLRRRRIGG